VSVFSLSDISVLCC